MHSNAEHETDFADAVADRSYQLWAAAGKPPAPMLPFYLQAERELRDCAYGAAAGRNRDGDDRATAHWPSRIVVLPGVAKAHRAIGEEIRQTARTLRLHAAGKQDRKVVRLPRRPVAELRGPDRRRES